jgi:hypothetical protein
VRDDGRSVRGLILALLLAACSRDPGPALQVTGETTKVRDGDALPARSPFFDGQRVTLRAARGETLGVAVWRRAKDAAQVSLVVEGADVRGYQVRSLPVRRASTSMYGPSDGTGRWPDRLEPVDTTERGGAVAAERVAFFDVAVPRDAAPGAHEGELVVGDARYPVELRVDAVTMPPIDESPRVWAYYDPREIARAAGVSAGSGLEAERAFAAMMRRYGVAASPDLGLDQWATHGDFLRGVPWVPVVLPEDPAEEAAAIRGWLDALAATKQQPFAIPIDEPRGVEAKRAVRARAERVRAAGQGKFLYAVTAGPDPIYGDLVDVHISPFLPTLEEPGGDRRWTYNGTPPFAGAMILDTGGAALRTWGWIGYRYRIPLWYVWDSAYWSDRHNERKRGGPRFPAQTAIDSDAVTFDDGEDRGNLDGVLAFWGASGPVPSWRLASLRRGLQDRALLELLDRCDRARADAIAKRMIPKALGDAGKPGASHPGAWPLDEARWEAARVELLDALAACAATR